VAVRGDRAVARTPDLLERLRAAGVVDAGGAGLVEIVRGLAAALTGDALPAPDAGGRAAAGPDALHQGLSRYRYCTTFAVAGEHLDAAALERELATFGDSLLVVGDETALKVHVHTDDHERAVALGERQGQILETEIADMHAQTREREERLAARLGVATLETGVVAVAAGAGNRALFESFAGTRVVDGGPSANPSTEELLEAVESLDAAGVIVLPNDPNAVASARQAAAQASRPVRVVPSRSVGAGLAAIVAHVPTLSLADNERLMTEVLEEIATGEVTRASRDATVDGVPVRAGDWLGLVDGRVVRSGAELQDVALAVVEAALDGRRSLVTLVTGEEQVDLGPLRAAVEERHPLVELEVHDGGQPHYPLLVVAE
jgi:DAK2 domain fusion protein YloV